MSNMTHPGGKVDKGRGLLWDIFSPLGANQDSPPVRAGQQTHVLDSAFCPLAHNRRPFWTVVNIRFHIQKSTSNSLWPFGWDQLKYLFEIWRVLYWGRQHSLAGACALWSDRSCLSLTALILWFGCPVGTLHSYLKMHNELWDAIMLSRCFMRYQQQKTFWKWHHIIIHFTLLTLWWCFLEPFHPV